MPEIAIDACVFIHLLNPEQNEGSHIDALLSRLIRDSFMLLVDSTGRIGKDYEAQVIPMIRSSDDTGNKRLLLSSWLQIERRSKVDLNSTDPLMTAIKGVIHEAAEHADRAFVYVACRQNATLITNDTMHILDRRPALLKKTKKLRGANTAFRSSQEAAACFCAAGGHV